MNSFGKLLRVSVFGESHGEVVGVTVDGIPAGISIVKDDFYADLQRRRSGAKGTTPRKETDEPQIISGYFQQKTTGAPFTVVFQNSNIRSNDYNFREIPRPGHADFTADKKFHGFQDDRGGGHFSGRMTLGLVVAGVVAKKIIPEVTICASLISANGNNNIEEELNIAIEKNDSIGGIVECCVSGLPIGLGEPFFNSVESLISHAVFSIPAIKGIEFGVGFAGANMYGSEHNDLFVNKNGATQTNNNGGINGGLTNGNDLVFRVVVKPTSSIALPQKTFNFQKNELQNLEIKGRHDVCIALRVPVVIEAVTAFVLADLFLIHKSYSS